MDVKGQALSGSLADMRGAAAAGKRDVLIYFTGRCSQRARDPARGLRAHIVATLAKAGPDVMVSLSFLSCYFGMGCAFLLSEHPDSASQVKGMTLKGLVYSFHILLVVILPSERYGEDQFGSLQYASMQGPSCTSCWGGGSNLVTSR